ncbi:uncharacterized protein RAG0_11229 [Rhynchosporium agropyri]|uniref:Uncharacterized protein n=1 Tax=Rhynchosporium agropyri TaxID=914238 RepID=A0A1E1L3A6_9HELO|nr:uncharacterized protein RAG0_11229 [Rhynchosporium agropyri]
MQFFTTIQLFALLATGVLAMPGTTEARDSVLEQRADCSRIREQKHVVSNYEDSDFLIQFPLAMVAKSLARQTAAAEARRRHATSGLALVELPMSWFAAKPALDAFGFRFPFRSARGQKIQAAQLNFGFIFVCQVVGGFRE